MQTLKTPKKVVLQDTITAYTVRGSFDTKAGQLRSFHVLFLNAKKVPVHPALAPPQVRYTAAELDAIVATPRLTPHETDQAWVERAAAPFVQKTYGLT
jgi:hypothetical protein